LNGLWPYVAALIPSVGVGILFWIVIKNMIEADRKERLAHSQWEAEHQKNAVEQEKDGSEPQNPPAAARGNNDDS
jgi:hypothetical protein